MDSICKYILFTKHNFDSHFVKINLFFFFFFYSKAFIMEAYGAINYTCPIGFHNKCQNDFFIYKLSDELKLCLVVSGR